MHLTVPTTDSVVPTVRTDYILLYFSLICLPCSAYRRRTTKSLDDLMKPAEDKRRGRPKGFTVPKELTRPKSKSEPKLKPKPKPKPKKRTREGSEYDEDAPEDDDDDGDGDDDDDDVPEESDGDTEDDDPEINYDDTDANANDDGWLDKMKADDEYADDPNMLLTSVTATPIDFETEYQTKSSWWVQQTTPTTIPTSTALMDLNMIGFNETWCSWVNQSEAQKLEGKAFVEAVQKLCSEEYAEDNDIRIALKHTFTNRKVIDKLMNNIVAKLSENDEEKMRKILNPKHKVNTQNEFCFGRAMKTFKYICFDPDANPYMQRYLKVLSNACRLPGVDQSVIREHLMDVCKKVDNSLANVL